MCDVHETRCACAHQPRLLWGPGRHFSICWENTRDYVRELGESSREGPGELLELVAHTPRAPDSAAHHLFVARSPGGQ